MDVGINKPFKDYICHCVEDFLTTNLMNTKLSHQVASNWIGNAWENIPQQMTVNTWKHVWCYGDRPHPHPDPEKEEMNEHHDPLALHPVTNTLVVNDNNECNTDHLLEV